MVNGLELMNTFKPSLTLSIVLGIFTYSLCSFATNPLPPDVKVIYDELLKSFVNFSSLKPKSYEIGDLDTHYLSIENLRDHNVVEWTYPAIFGPDETMGWRHMPNKIVKHLLRTQKKIIWNISYKYDSNGNRITPQSNLDSSRFLVFLGDSFVHGNGLGSRETLPFQTVKHLPNTKAYNLGIAAAGPHQHLARILSGVLKKQFDEKAGVFIYVLLSQHIQRANGFAIQRSIYPYQPVFDFEGDSFKSIGKFMDVEPVKTRLLGFLHKRLNLFRRLNFNYPKVDYSHILYTCRILSQMKKSLKKQFPSSSVFIYPHPLSPSPESLISCLKEKNVNLFLLDSISKTEKKMHELFPDHHPNAYHNRVYGKILAEKLRRVAW